MYWSSKDKRITFVDLGGVGKWKRCNLLEKKKIKRMESYRIQRVNCAEVMKLFYMNIEFCGIFVSIKILESYFLFSFLFFGVLPTRKLIKDL